MCRLLLACALFLAVPAPAAVAAQSGSSDFEHAISAALDSIYMLGVARRNATGPEVFQFIGTGWVIAEGRLATNAHVAEALLESSTEGRLIAKRSWSDRDELALSPRGMRIHPAYAPWNARLKRVVVRNEGDPAAARSMSFIPVADVAIVEVEAGNTAPPLVLSDPTQVEPALSEPVVYLGFPHENISGFPTLHVVPGYVTAKTDFFFQRGTWAESYLIHYCGPVVGGASGSPMLNRAGQVIGLISAAENNLSMDGARTSFGFAYGQRVDLARELLRDDYAELQHARDEVWCERLTKLLLPPDELLEQIALAQATIDGLSALTNANTVTRRQVLVKQGEPARLQVTLEPGLRYGFLAAAHDGTDVDALVSGREGGDVLGVDTETDYFPVVWIGPLAERTAVTFEVAASELLLRDTTCTVHVYKFEPQLAALEPDGAQDAAFFHADVTTPQGGGTLTWRFLAQPGTQLFFSAESAEGFDIDLLLALDGELVAADESPDAVPVLLYALETGGELELRLRIPAGASAGSAVAVKGLLLDGTRPALLSAADEGAQQRVFSAEELSLQLDDLFVEMWANAGVEGEFVAQDVLALEGARELVFDVPAGCVPIFVALAPRGEDIDAELVLDGVVVIEDKAGDNTPMVALDAAEGERKVVLRLIDSVTGARVEQVAWRFCMLRPL